MVAEEVLAGTETIIITVRWERSNRWGGGGGRLLPNTSYTATTRVQELCESRGVAGRPGLFSHSVNGVLLFSS